jgi:hypothetical protein
VPVIAACYIDAYVCGNADIDAVTFAKAAMIRFFFRLLALFFLTVAIILAVVDATNSVAAGEYVTTSLGQSWFSFSPATINLAQAVVQRYTLPFIWDPVAVWILTLPGFAVFAALALIFYAIGHKPRRRARSLPA